MRKAVRRLAVAAGAAGLLLTGAAPAAASADWPFDSVGNGDSNVSGNSERLWTGGLHVYCRGGERICANGPVNSGNLKNSQNVTVKGSSNNSADVKAVSGSVNSQGYYEGPRTNSGNNVQNINMGDRHRGKGHRHHGKGHRHRTRHHR